MNEVEPKESVGVIKNPLEDNRFTDELLLITDKIIIDPYAIAIHDMANWFEVERLIKAGCAITH